MSVVATTYVWHLTHYIDGNSDVDIWWPNTPDNIEIGYSLHLYNPDATGIIGISDITNCKIYPNPANDVLYASIVLSKTENVAISITDITGRVLEIKTYLPTTITLLFLIRIIWLPEFIFALSKQQAYSK